MSEPVPVAVVDGVDVDAVAAAAVRGQHVRRLVGDADRRRIATYLPGRVVEGIRIDDDAIVISLEVVWDSPVNAVVDEVTTAVTGLVGTRRVDVVIAAIADPGEPADLPELTEAHPDPSAPVSVPPSATPRPSAPGIGTSQR